MTPEDLREALLSLVKGQLPPPNLSFGEVTEVDWPAKTCTVKDLVSDLEVYDVLLSVNGSEYDVKKPKDGTTCIIGLLENKETDAFMVWCEEYEEWHLNGDGKGGLVMAPETVDRLNKIEDKLNGLIDILKAWSPVAQDGGAKLKSDLVTWVATKLQKTGQSDIESKTVKHGG